ncbi:MAG: hypothetical protein U1A78_06180 [Polyangia bacterium]
MRAVIPLCFVVGLGLGTGLSAAGCAGLSGGSTATALKTELELAHDDGQPAERPVLGTPEFEWLLRFDPSLPSYRASRLRLLVAQPGKLRLALYRHDEATGRPGQQVALLERSYDFSLTSGGRDGKWVLEPIPQAPTLSGPVWVGLSVPQAEAGARLWASRRESEHAFQRDAEPGTALQSSRLPVTPMVRLLVEPQAAPGPSPSPGPSAKPPAAAAGKGTPAPARP